MNLDDLRRRAREAAERISASGPARTVLDNQNVREAVDAAGATFRAVREEVGRASSTVHQLVVESGVDDLAELKQQLAKLKADYEGTSEPIPASPEPGSLGGDTPE
jgi:hypothetical protein